MSLPSAIGLVRLIELKETPGYAGGFRIIESLSSHLSALRVAHSNHSAGVFRKYGYPSLMAGLIFQTAVKSHSL